MKAPATLPGLHKFPDLHQAYLREWRIEAARCGGDCFTAALVQRYARLLQQRQALEARP